MLQRLFRRQESTSILFLLIPPIRSCPPSPSMGEKRKRESPLPRGRRINMEEDATATARGLPDELASTDQGMGVRAVTADGKSDNPKQETEKPF